jgi:hypothetical protein
VRMAFRMPSWRAAWGEAGLAGKGEEPPDALLGAWAGEGVPDVGGERAGSAEAGEGVGAAGDAVPDADAGVAGCGGEGLYGDADLGGDVFEAALAVLVVLAEPVRVDAAVRGRGRLAEPGARPGGPFAGFRRVSYRSAAGRRVRV